MTTEIFFDLDVERNLASIRLMTYIGGDRFKAFRSVLINLGARWSKEDRRNYLPISAVGQAILELQRAGFSAAADPKIVASLQDRAQEAKALQEAGRARIEAVEARLAADGLKLFRYQRTGVEWLSPRTGACLADEMGLGKTVEALVALPEQAAAIVITNKSLTFNWAREAQRWRSDLKPTVVRKRTEFFRPRPGEIAIVSYGLLPHPDQVRSLEAGTCVIVDEAHALKNKKTKRYERFNALSEAIEQARGSIWLVTGTPLLNRPNELWNILELAKLGTESFGDFWGFANAMGAKKSSYGLDWGEPKDEVPDLLRTVLLRRRRVDVLPDLPKKMRTEILVDGINEDAIRACDRVVAALADNGIDLDSLADDVASSKIGAIAFEEISRARSLLAAAKVPALLEIVEAYEDSETPIVVFSDHVAPVDAVATREGWASITGKTSAEERQSIVDRFQRGELRGLAGTIKAMGVGLTLTHSCNAIFVDRNWTPAMNSQAEDRLARIGQTQPVTISILVAPHQLDERMARILTAKQDLIDRTVEAASVQEDYLGESQVDAASEAAELAAALSSDFQQAERQALEARAAATRANVERVKASLGQAWDGRELTVLGKLRSAANAVESHAVQAIIALAQLDPDRASSLNDVGFNKVDGEFGHSLATQLQERGGLLTDKQWAAAIKLVRKYHRQVGRPS